VDEAGPFISFTHMSMRPPDDSETDEQLLARISKGEAHAFTQLFRRRQAGIYRFALHMTGVSAVADDVTQDVFMIVMREAATYRRGQSGVMPWLCGIARNCARQRLRRDRRFEPLEPFEPAENEGAGAASAAGAVVQADPVDDLTRAQGIARVRRAVLSLPVRYREVIVLCELQELTYAEAAQALGCAIGTVRSRLHRARALLAEKLSAQNEPRGATPCPARSCA
jgi:RNA polymerase sigma-70 factor (ECF subfamily)